MIWKDRKYINPRKRVFKNMDTNEILNLEIQDDPENIEEESETPLNAHNLNQSQQDMLDDMSKTYAGTNITGPTVEGYGRINKLWGRSEVINENVLNMPNYSYSSYGVQTTYNQGQFHIEGTLTDTYFFLNNLTDCNIPIGTYILSISRELDFYMLEFHVKYSDGTTGAFNFTNQKVKRINLTKNVTAFRIAFSGIATGTNVNYDFSIKLAQIHCVGDDVNLFDGNLHIELDGEYRHASTGQKVSNSNVYGLKIPVKPNTQYILNADITNDNITNLCFFDKDMKYLSGNSYNGTDKKLTTPTNCAYITSAISKNFTKLKLQKGSVATPYSPYGKGTVEIISKNGDEQSSNVCYIKNGLSEDDYIDYKLQKVIRADGTEESLNCSNKIVQYVDETTVHNRDNAEIEVSLTNNKAISEVNGELGSLQEKQIQMRKYSTEEQVVGTWIDGKPLYRKVFKVTSDERLAFEDILSQNIDMAILCGGYVKGGGGSKNSI